MPARVRLKTIALPIEHGGWGFLFEPIVLGLLVAPTPAGFCLSLTAVASFLSRHPLKLVLKHGEGLESSPRIRAALCVTLAYAGIGLAAFVVSVAIAGLLPLVPLLILSPLVALYLLYDTKAKARELVAELAGPLGLAGVAPAVALADGWSWSSASALWLVLVSRAIPSISYVRARLRLERSMRVSPLPVILNHILFGCGLWLLAWQGLVPYLTLAAMLILLFRAAHGLSPRRPFTRTKQIGFAEIGFGALYVLVSAAGYWTGI